MYYDYIEKMVADVESWCIKNFEQLQEYQTPEELSEYLNDTLFCEDSVTGNGSGSYTFDNYLARDYVLGNIDTLQEAISEFYVSAEEVTRRFLNNEWEYFDVTIRCFLLPDAIWHYINKLKDEKYF